MKKQIIIAGHAGQGVLELEYYFSYYVILKGRLVAYTPSYGPETRGGKVKCYVVTSDEAIDSPIVEAPEYLLVMNDPSMDYVSLLKKNGMLLMNSSLIDMEPSRSDIHVTRIPATEMAFGLKDTGLKAGIQDTKIVANTVMLGAYLSVEGEELDEELTNKIFSRFLTGRKSPYVKLNISAVRRGYEYVKNKVQAPVMSTAR